MKSLKDGGQDGVSQKANVYFIVLRGWIGQRESRDWPYSYHSRPHSPLRFSWPARPRYEKRIRFFWLAVWKQRNLERMSKCSRGLLARKYDEMYRVSLLFPMELLLLEEKKRNSSFRKQLENQARNQGGARGAMFRILILNIQVKECSRLNWSLKLKLLKQNERMEKEKFYSQEN